MDQEREEVEDTVKSAGRGFLVITAAKLWFMVTGAAIQLGLPILFGSAQLFGVFKIVTEVVSLINMVVVMGSLQAVSKLVSERPEQANRILTQALKLQCALGLPLAILYFLGSPWVAEYGFHDPSLAGIMRLSSFIVLFYAFYSTFVGYINGRKLFVEQAGLDITFQTLKTFGIIGLVVAGTGVMGAIAGFVGAAGAVCVLSAFVTWHLMRTHSSANQEPQDDVTARDDLKRLGRFLGVIVLYTFALNALLRADLFVIKSVASVPPAGFEGLSTMFTMVSDKFAGIYGAALNLARLPYQGVIAVTFVIFPLISEATFQEDRERTRQYIESTFRYCLILIGGVALPLIFNADSVIAALYSSDYQAASTALVILSVAIIAFALFYVATTVIIGAGRPVVALVLMAISFLVSAVMNVMLVNGVHAEVMAQMTWSLSTATGGDAVASMHAAVDHAAHDAALGATYLKHAPEYMQAAATATAVAMTTGFLGSLVWLWRVFEATPPWKTVVRLLVAAGVLFVIDMVFPSPVAWKLELGKISYLGVVAAKMVVMGLALLATLVITREFGASDLARARAVLGRKKKTEES